MYKGTTPTVTITLKDQTVDLTAASHVYVTIASRNKNLIRKEDAALDVSEHSVALYLTQEETLALPQVAFLQLNWTYIDGDTRKRACSEIVPVRFNPNLEAVVLA